MKKVFLFAIAALMSASMFADNITVAKAIEIGTALDDNKETTEAYTVEGYCAKLYGRYSDQYGSQSFYMSDDKNADPSLKTYNFEAYQCKFPNFVLPQSKVTVTGKIKKYVSDKSVTTIEIVQGEGAILEAGPEITVVGVTEAVEIGNALADNAYTNKYYSVRGYAVKAYDKTEKGYQTIFMADETGAFGPFEAFSVDPGKDWTIAEGDYLEVIGLIQKYVKSGSDPQIEISNGFANQLEEPSAINNVNAQSVKAMKVVENGQLFIIRNGVKYNAAGAIVK